MLYLIQKNFINFYYYLNSLFFLKENSTLKIQNNEVIKLQSINRFKNHDYINQKNEIFSFIPNSDFIFYSVAFLIVVSSIYFLFFNQNCDSGVAEESKEFFSVIDLNEMFSTMFELNFEENIHHLENITELWKIYIQEFDYNISHKASEIELVINYILQFGGGG